MYHPSVTFALDMSRLEDLVEEVKYVAANPLVEKCEGISERIIISAEYWKGIWYILLLSKGPYVNIVSFGNKHCSLILVRAAVIRR